MFLSRENQVIEYWPLLNPRTHDVEISFQEFEEHYYHFLTLVAFDSTSVSDIKLQHKLILCFCLLTRVRSFFHFSVTFFSAIAKLKDLVHWPSKRGRTGISEFGWPRLSTQFFRRTHAFGRVGSNKKYECTSLSLT